MMNISKRDFTIIHLLVMITIIAIFFILPPVGSLTQIGMRVIGVFIAVVYGWSVANLIWPSLIAIVALPFTGIATMNEFIAAGLGNDTIYFLIFILIFSEWVNSSGLNDFIANWFISRRILNGRPWLFITFFFLGCMAMGFMVNAFLGMLVMWGILFRLCEIAGYKPYDKWPTMMQIGILLFHLIGIAIPPYRGFTLILLGSYSRMGGQPVDMFSWISFSIPMALISLLIYLFVWKFIIRVDVKPLANILNGEIVDKSTLVLTKQKKMVLGYFVVFILLLFLPSLMPEAWLLTGMLKKLGNGGIITFILLCMCFTKVDGKPTFDFNAMAKKGVAWDIILAGMLVIPLGTYLTDEATGVTSFILGLLTPVFGSLPYVVFFFVVFAVATLLTNVMSNLVVAFVLIPVVMGIAANAGANELPIVFMIILAVHYAILTPAACAYTAMALARKDWLKTSDMYKYGGITVLFLIIALGIFGYLWTSLVL